MFRFSQKHQNDPIDNSSSIELSALIILGNILGEKKAVKLHMPRSNTLEDLQKSFMHVQFEISSIVFFNQKELVILDLFLFFLSFI